jgi:hypothetical protein
MAFKDVRQVFELAYRESAAREEAPERDTPTLTPIDRLVWAVLAHHKNHESGLCCPSYERLMRVTGLGRTALSASLQRLKNLSWISVERHGRASRYSWKFPELPEALAEALPDDEVRETNFSSSRNEPQKAAKRISEVRETASNRVFKTGREEGKERSESEAATVTVPNGQRSTVAATPTSLRDETTTTPKGDPDKTTATATTTTKASGESLPIPLTFTPLRIGVGPVPKNFDFGCIPLDEEGFPNLDFPILAVEAQYLVNIWNTESKKPAYVEDFLRLLRKGHPYFAIQTYIQWMFRESHWASESHNHKGGWDIQSSGVFANHYDQIHEQCLLYLSKQQPEQVDAIPGAEPQPDTGQDSQELEQSEDSTTCRGTTNGSAGLEPDDDLDEEAWRQEPMKLHSAPVSDDDDEDFSEEVPDVDTLAEPGESRNTRRERRLPRPSHIYSGRMPLPRSNNQPQVAPAPDACVSAEEEDSSGFEEEEPEEESGPVDLTAVWKQASNTDLDILDLWLILREEELPGRNPDEYLADVIRWTMQFWPGREQLKAGSRSFKQHFKEIHEDYATQVNTVTALVYVMCSTSRT